MVKLLKALRTYGPSREHNHWAMTVRTAPYWLIPVRSLTQIFGGKKWSLVLVRMGEPTPAEEFWVEES